MFPGSTLTTAPIPNSTNYTLNVNGETRQRYELNVPGQGTLSAGLLWQQFQQWGASGPLGINNVAGFNAQAAAAVLPSGTPVSGPVNYVTGNPGQTPVNTTGLTPGSSGEGSGIGTESGQIITSTLPDATVGTLYNQGVIAYHPSSSIRSWALATGTLPAGLSLNTTTGVISGIPTAANTAGAQISLRVTFTNNQTVTKNLTLKINPSANGGPGTATTLSISTSTLPGGRVGTAYSQTLTATGATGVTWALASGTLPAGLTLSSAGVISGTPSAAATSTFTVKASSAGQTDVSKQFTIIISTATNTAAAPTITSVATLPSAQVGAVYSQTLVGTNVSSWAVTTGSLPAGLSLNATTGVISGIPIVAKTTATTFTVTATGNGQTVVKDFTIPSVNAAAGNGGTTTTTTLGNTNLNTTPPSNTSGGTPTYVTSTLFNTTTGGGGSSATTGGGSVFNTTTGGNTGGVNGTFATKILLK
jgi:hypothetical protein